jgi:DNA-binding transcriptional regulator LsrR (DeoR family)
VFVSKEPKLASLIEAGHDGHDWHEGHDSFDMTARVASLYYLEDKTQSDIAEQLGLSRQKVQRLLKQAREKRIVEIHVHSIPVLHIELENKIKHLFGLKDVIVAPTHPNEQNRRLSVARAAASYLERRLTAGSKVAIGLGRNTGSVSEIFRQVSPSNAIFVSGMGGSPHFGATINPNEICSRFASNSGGTAELLYAPVYVEGRRMRNFLLSQDTVSRTLNIARSAEIALIGVGTIDDESILVTAGCLSLAEAQHLRSIGAVGEILGNYYDTKGNYVDSDLNGRLIALSMDELRSIPITIAVASEPEKATAVLGALRTKAIQVLVTECNLAISILKLAGVDNLQVDESFLDL